ncbi:MAG: multidrug effflux MFS transporter [Alphaproteobacteria bacterium]|nr:multidrug effflux MFS transporter [Alphaproteobacteria bacterium]
MSLTWDRARLPLLRRQNSAVPVAAARPAAAAARELTPLRMTIVGALLITLGPLSMSLYTPAMTLLIAALHTTEHTIHATITVYLFGFAASQLICGPLSDRFGRRPILIGGLILYFLGSLLSAAAGSATTLILGRLVQGIGACGSVALSRVMVADRFAGNGAARIISLMSLILSIAPAAAPVLGGTLITVTSWRVLFVLLAAYAVLLLGLAWYFPETNERRDPRATQPRSLAVNYATLLTSRAFMGQVVLTSLAIGGFYGWQALAPFVLMGKLGLSSPMFGLVTGSLMVSYLVGSLALNRLLRWFSTSRLVLAGALMVLVAAISLLLGLRILGLGIAQIIAPMWLWMVGFAFIMPGVTLGALALFPRNAGSASALMGSLQMGMGFVATALCGLFHDAGEAFATVPPAMGVLAVVAYLAANRGLLSAASPGR